MGPFSDPLASSTFPRRHHTSQQERSDECALVPRTPATKANRIPANLLDQFEAATSQPGWLPHFAVQAHGREHRSDSPGRIRHLVHSGPEALHQIALPGGTVQGQRQRRQGQPGRDPDCEVRQAQQKQGAAPGAQAANNNIVPSWWSSDDNLTATCASTTPPRVMTMGRCPDRRARRALRRPTTPSASRR